MLIGSTNGSVDLNTFTFDEPISLILQRKSIKFTLLGYCIDDECTKEVAHNFDKAPTSEQIQSGEVKKRGIDINPGDIAGKVGDVAKGTGEKAGEIATDVGNNAGQIATDAGNEATGFVDNAARTIVNALLSAFDNFIPKEPTNGKSGWIARPIITASIFDTLALLLLLITNTENRKYCYPLAFILLLISFILNIVSLFITFSLFSLVFNVIGAFPGIGDNKTGPALSLSGFSSLFLLIAISLIIIDGSRRKSKNFK